jgi:signal peptidase II
MRKANWEYFGLMCAAGTIVILDQWTKTLLRSRLMMGETWVPWDWLRSIILIVRTQNTGAAFSLGRGLGPLFTLLAIGAVLAILFYYPRLTAMGLAPHTLWMLRMAMGLLLGGAVGNLIDRLLYGQVTDFISIRYFAVVNIADISISAGAAVLILWLWIEERQAKKQAAQSEI